MLLHKFIHTRMQTHTHTHTEGKAMHYKIEKNEGVEIFHMCEIYFHIIIYDLDFQEIFHLCFSFHMKRLTV